MFGRKFKINFIDKDWKKIKSNVRVNAVPRIHELVYFGADKEYYRVSRVVHWPNQDSGIFIVVELLSDIEATYNKRPKDGDNEKY